MLLYFTFQAYKDKLDQLTAQKNVLQLQLDAKTKELQDARLLIEKLTMNGHLKAHSNIEA